MGVFEKFMEHYHNHPTGAKKFFEDAYGRMGDYETNFGLQSDMIDHASKHVGKYVLQHPEATHEDVYKELKQKKLDLEREAFNSAGSHLNGAPNFQSMFLPKGKVIESGIEDGSSVVRQKQERNQHNQVVLRQFGITPKAKTEGNNVVNAKDRFKMKKSQVIDMLIKSFSQMPTDMSLDTSQLIKALKEKGETLSKSDIDEISSHLIDIQSRIKQHEDKAADKERRVTHNNRVMEKYKNFDETQKRLQDVENKIKELHAHIFGNKP